MTVRFRLPLAAALALTVLRVLELGAGVVADARFGGQTGVGGLERAGIRALLAHHRGNVAAVGREGTVESTVPDFHKP